METLNYVFNLCIIIGFLIPLLNIFTGWFGDFLGADLDFDTKVDVDVSTDAGADINVEDGGIIPFNVMCLCLFLVVFGALGHAAKVFMTNPLFMVLLLFGCFALSGSAYWLMYKLLIKRLKSNDASALTYRNLRGKSAEVTLSIHGDSIGTISLRDSTGAPISFRAKMDADLKDRMPDIISKGESVIITEVDKENKLCFISVPFNKLSKAVVIESDEKPS